jgi:hypothetical protein
MHFRLSPSAWLRRTIGLLALVPALVHVGPVAAQSAPVAKHYTHDAVFDLPITVDEKSLPTISEVQLFVKTPTSDWRNEGVKAPTDKAFKYKAPADGEYWFTLVTKNTKGELVPADFSRMLPGSPDVVVVVVDTMPPAFEVVPIKAPGGGEWMLRCTVTDANPNPTGIKITYRGNDQMMHTLEQLPGQNGLFRVPSPEVLSQPLTVTVTDMAKNTTTREVNMQDLMPKPAAAQAPVGPASSGVVQAGGAGAMNNNSGVAQMGSFPPPPPSGYIPPPIETRPPQTPTALPGSIQRQLLNTTRASLDYRIDQVGPSGVGKVEVWLTSDQGSNWRRLCEDADRRSPAEFDLPGDGLYGVRVVVTNGNGFGGRTPAPGEQPHVWIEVDTIAPQVHLKDLEPVSNGSSIDIRWTATDKNMAAEPITLYYATRREGPWLPLARGLKNDGQYRWTFPRDAGSQFFIRLEAVDQAGNVARCESPTAITLDMTEPRASVVGVTGVGVQAPGIRGN